VMKERRNQKVEIHGVTRVTVDYTGDGTTLPRHPAASPTRYSLLSPFFFLAVSPPNRFIDMNIPFPFQFFFRFSWWFGSGAGCLFIY